MKNLHIKNSYKIWDTYTMSVMIWDEFVRKAPYDYSSPSIWLNRSYNSMYIEWWIHNIGYYLTLPFCEYNFIRRLNLRFKDVDLNEWK